MLEFLWWPVFLVIPLPLLLRLTLPETGAHQAHALRTPYFQQWLSMDKEAQDKSTFKYIRGLLLILIWLLVVTATARPQYVGDAIDLPSSGRDLLLAVDISGSMEATDLELSGRKVSRLDVVKSVLDDFIDRREGDRIGLILFGEQAYLQTPLTFDRDTVRIMLNESAIGLAGASRTAIGDGIGLAVKRLQQRQVDSRVLILLTDGQNNTGAVSPLKAAELASQVGIKIYTIGVGAERMVVDSFFGKRTLNPSKDLDEDTLIAVAEATDGQYFRARNTQELEEIYAVLDAVEPVEDDPETFRPVKALFYWPLGLALLLASLLLIEQRFSAFMNRPRGEQHVA
ncbi:MAG: VWA domain-containing protein [Gammaproteobacteria bacterium]|jgi:Ca-activated chloride channel family protein